MNQKGFLGRQLQSLQRRWQAIAGSEYDQASAELRPDLPTEDRDKLLGRLRECVDGRGGEVVARARAAALGRIYMALAPDGRRGFLELLAREFDLDPEEVHTSAQALAQADDPRIYREARRRLLEVTESPRARILTRFNALPEGVKFLVDLRAELLPLTREDAGMASLDDDLKGLLAAWFDVDFLQLRRISWTTAPGALLEKFMAYEAVHPVESWEDLKNRMDRDRRYFAFFHPRMPEEPLIFLEVALVRGLSGSVQDLLDPDAPQDDPTEADTAVFYSISNAQKGLAGISFGGFLIKRVVEELAQDLPNLKTFATLSPLPRFRAWLEDVLGEDRHLVAAGDMKRLRKWTDEEGVNDWLGGVLMESLWREDATLEKAVRPVFLKLAGRYLVEERGTHGRALDPVAHFHLSNGARIERLNWGADVSERGMAQSAGVMVNYLYDLKRIEVNHEAYKGRGEVVTSPSLRGSLKG